MGTYPTKPSTLLAWNAAHLPIFQDHAEQLGLSDELVGTYKAAMNDYAEKAAAVVIAREAYRVAVQQAEHAARTMRLSTGDTVAVVRAFADTSKDPGAIYELAQLPMRAARTPSAPPATPSDVAAELDASTGGLTLRWKASNPRSGTSYIVRRKLPGEAAFTIIATAPGKHFTDTTLAPGLSGVQYTVQGTRAGRLGRESNVLAVNFGGGVGGGSSESAPVAHARAAARLVA